MLKPITTTKFKRDLKRGKKQQRDLAELKKVMEKLINEEALAAKYRDHKLLGELKDCRECHVENDWLLIYRIADDEITFVALGSHAELFKK
ncbi:MAG TPA: type II toxin-antitoxin system YafQ family toxin [Myxococcota bacterium]|nr:type II toxin-antitoxin system YafQ family toxin [Myxococcota bacterium]